MSNDLRPIVGVDRVIHEPARLLIVAILSGLESADFLYLLRETGLTKGNLSSHLARLEETGYVHIEKTFHGKLPLTICRLTASGQQAFKDYRKKMRQMVDHPGVNQDPQKPFE